MPPLPTDVDHLVYAAPELESGVVAMERLLGTRAVIGGRHPQYGTHNALLSLGPATYLEIVAVDPEFERPPRGRPFGVESEGLPRLVTWAARCEEIDVRATSANAAGRSVGRVEAGSRARPDGTMVHWRLTDPYVMAMDGVIPFLLAWGDTPHPATNAPAAGRFVGLRIEHPDPAAVHAALSALGTSADVHAAARPALVATIRVGSRLIELR